jgi:D-beta-D-heptose 7-phosphate kinase/D-beta-D-heptose 1-phosphate adenosyltransferase
VTLDCDGMLLASKSGEAFRIPVAAAPESGTSGAGDTLLSTLTLAWRAGCAPRQAAEMAIAATAVVTSDQRARTCPASRLASALGCALPGQEFAGVAGCIENERRIGRRIVLTNGCFDILHRGHVAYLREARQLGDVLVVGVNVDETVKRLKGPGRPVNPLADRVEVLSALSAVDFAVPFAEATPHRLIEAVRPDVFVKGGDYTRETLPEADLVESLGGRVVLLPFVPHKSTTRIIERIRTVPAVVRHGEPGWKGDRAHERPRLGRIS